MNNESILLVEDNPDDEALTLQAFRNPNLANESYVVRDGAEALEFLFAEGAYARRHEEVISKIVFLDLMLPRVGSIEVLQRIRGDERTKLLPVVILTSSDEERDVVDSYKFGANSYVQKPVDFAKFSEAVAQLGLYWMLLNRPPPRDEN